MNIFYLCIFLVLIIGTGFDLFKEKYRIISIILGASLVLILALISGLRNNIGDTGAYVHLYKLIESGYSGKGYEPGFILFLAFLKGINEDPQFMIFVTGFITTTLNLKTLKRYSVSLTLAIYLYITSGYYIVTMNGIRQSLAAAVMFFVTKLIEKNKFGWYLVVVLAMSTFHSSVLIMIPFYFVIKNESWSKKLISVMILAIVILLMYPYAEGLIFSLLGARYSQYKDFNEGGANIFRIAISGVPVVLAYIKKGYIKDNWKESYIFVNMSLLNFIIMCFSYYNWIFARFNIYTQLYSFVLLPYLVINCFSKRENKLIIYLLLVLYFIFFWYDSAVIMNIQYRSNFIRI